MKYFSVASSLCLLVLQPGVGAAYSFQTIANFSGDDGMGPESSLIQDKVGNLWGVTMYGGDYSLGTVYKLSINNNWNINKIVSFDGSNGSMPVSSLVLDPAGGNLYGATFGDGPGGGGVVFQLKPTWSGSYQISIITSFDGANGSNPDGGLVMDSVGNLYGTTSGLGADVFGTVFMLNKGLGWRQTTIATFNGFNGANTFAGLVFDANRNNLYGTTAWGGATGNGTVFALNRAAGWQPSTIINFNDANGSNPRSGLVFGPDGNLYGTTTSGGLANKGTVFQLAKNTRGVWNLSTCYNFTGANGSYPHAGVVFDKAGELYGTTYYGGSNNFGIVFRLTPPKPQKVGISCSQKPWTYTTIISFAGANGSYPESALLDTMLGKQEVLYGTTESGGAGNAGTVFAITP